MSQKEHTPQAFKIPKAGNHYYRMLNVFLFSVMGISSYGFLLYYMDVWTVAQEKNLLSLPVILLVALVFNVICNGILYLNSSVNAHYPFAFEGTGRLFFFFVFVAAVLAAYNYFFCVLVRGVIGDPMPFLVAEKMWTQLLVPTLIELVIVCLMILNHSARFTIKLYREKEEMKQYQALAEFKALQTQLNPHFLFNSLNTLLSEIEYDPANAKLFTTRLAEVYRYILQTQDKRTVPLMEELEFLKAYMYLHQVRIGQGLKFECVLPELEQKESLHEKRIPPLALQLLIENALKHNVINSKRPLAISLTFSTDLKYMMVENELRPKKNVKSLGSGLKNLSERYRILSGMELKVLKTEKTFWVRLPLLDE